MADSQPSDEENETVTDPAESSERTDSQIDNSSRRTFMKTVGVAAALTGAGSMVGTASAAGSAGTYLNEDGEVHIPPGEYTWDGADLSISSGDAVIGDGNPGDVVFNLGSETMRGQIRGTLKNITVRGHNQDPQSGLRIYPGCTIDGFLWPEGGQEDRDMGIYTSEGGNDRVHIRNSGWAWMVNNGAYVDKPPVTVENCVAANNNISGIRVGHRDGTSSGQTTYIRNSIIAVTRNVPNDSTNSSNARGVRVRHPGNFVIENCWFVYLDVDKEGDLIVFHDDAAGANVTIRNCAFYNDSGGDLIRDKTGGDVDVTIENCTVEGSGSRNIDPSYSGSGFTEASAEYPLPSQVTGIPAADEIEGVGPGVGPWTEDGGTVSGSNDNNKTLVLHASPDNTQDIDVSFTVDGSISYGPEAESDTDTIVSNDDGSVTATSIALNPDALDSYYYDGPIVDYSVPDGATVDISVNGTTTSFAEVVEDGSTDDSTTDDGSTDDGSTDDGSTNDGSTDDSTGDGSTDDGSTDDGSTDDGSSGDGSTSTDTRELLLHASPDNTQDIDVSFTVDGWIDYSDESESDTDTVTAHDDGTVTATSVDLDPDALDSYLINGPVVGYSVPSDAAVDVAVDGTSTTFPELVGEDTSDDTTDDTSDDTSGNTPPHRLSVVGSNTERPAEYTFTVSGDVARDAEASHISDDSIPWDQMEDIARDGKVIGLVGSGVDAYRFDGLVTAFTVKGEAKIKVERDV